MRWTVGEGMAVFVGLIVLEGTIPVTSTVGDVPGWQADINKITIDTKQARIKIDDRRLAVDPMGFFIRTYGIGPSFGAHTML